MPAIGESGVEFTMVAREWRAKYAMDADGTPAKSAALAAAQKLFEEYKATLKALPGAEVTRIVCGGCGDFKVIVNQPCADHDALKAYACRGLNPGVALPIPLLTSPAFKPCLDRKEYAPEAEFLEKLKAIEGINRVETQEFTMEKF